MSRPRLLYLSINDGTDTRVAKEIATLSQIFDITFVGIRQEDNGPNRLPSTVRQHVILGRRRSLLTLLHLFAAVYQLKPAQFDTVHVVNENLLVVVSPLLLTARNLVLDVFDSMFLKSSIAVRIFRWPLQCFVHSLADTVIVTDEERSRLIPAIIRSNVRVLPNYPSSLGVLPARRIVSDGDPLRIFFSGSLAEGRGIPFLEALLDSNSSLEVIAAGWVYDDAARRLLARGRVSYCGVLSAAEAATVARGCDYILCLYRPDVPNNIYASPNKIYDAALIGIPVIINSEVRAASFVEAESLGVVLADYTNFSPALVLEELYRRRREFKRPASYTSPYVWESVQQVLLESHLNQ